MSQVPVSKVPMLPLTSAMVQIARNPSDPWLIELIQPLIIYGGDQSSSFDKKLNITHTIFNPDLIEDYN